MFYFDVICQCCKTSFRVYAGSEAYRIHKENRQATLVCEDCQDRIRHEAILDFMRRARG